MFRSKHVSPIRRIFCICVSAVAVTAFSTGCAHNCNAAKTEMSWPSGGTYKTRLLNAERSPGGVQQDINRELGTLSHVVSVSVFQLPSRSADKDPDYGALITYYESEQDSEQAENTNSKKGKEK